MAASVRTAARKRIHHARVWAAPRLDRTGHSLEVQVAPRMVAMLSAAAQRMEPTPARRHRRWPVLAGAGRWNDRRGRAERDRRLPAEAALRQCHKRARVAGPDDAITNVAVRGHDQCASRRESRTTTNLNGRVPT
jgi:hypothetical protein